MGGEERSLMGKQLLGKITGSLGEQMGYMIVCDSLFRCGVDF